MHLPQYDPREWARFDTITLVKTIRPLLASDAEDLAEALSRNREFLSPWEPRRPETYFTPDGQADIVSASLERQAAGDLYCLVITDESGAAAGRITLTITRGPFQSAIMGYWLCEHLGGRGLATAAVGETVDLAFGELGLHRIEAGTIPENYRSQSVLRKNGFIPFGYAPAYLEIAGRYRDHLLFQRLAPGIAASG